MANTSSSWVNQSILRIPQLSSTQFPINIQLPTSTQLRTFSRPQSIDRTLCLNTITEPYNTLTFDIATTNELVYPHYPQNNHFPVMKLRILKIPIATPNTMMAE